LSCGKECNADMYECPFCGAKQKDSAEPGACPVCMVPLQKACVRETSIYVCPTCRGMWTGADEFNFLVSERDVYADPSVSHSYEKKPLAADTPKRPYIPCPVCKQLMARKNFKHISGVLIDVCMKHGVWLDAGELSRIRDFIANVDYSEHLETSIELNKDEIGSLRRQLKHAELVQVAMHGMKLKYWLYK